MTTFAARLTSRLSSRAIGVGFAFVAAIVSGVSVFVNSKGVSHFDDATVYTTAKNAIAGALLVVLALPLLAARGALRARARRVRRAAAQWLGLVAHRLHRRQRPVRALLRGPLPRDRDAGRLHAEDARHLGGAARGAAAAGANPAGASRRDRARRGRPGVACRRRRHGHLRRRRGDDLRGDAAVGGRGDPRQAARRRHRPADARGRHGWRSAWSCSSPGSSSRAAPPRLPA